MIEEVGQRKKDSVIKKHKEGKHFALNNLSLNLTRKLYFSIKVNNRITRRAQVIFTLIGKYAFK